MKRVALGLCAWLALANQAAWAQESEAQPPSEAAPPAGEPAAEPPAAEPPTGETPKEGEAAKTPVEEIKAAKPWQDVFVVPRRRVLKRRRIEFMPAYSVTINNSVIRHHGFGGAINFYLSEALYLGIEATYYVKQLTDRYFLLGLNQRVLPSVNRYQWSALLDFGYVPIHGKFTLFNKSIWHWETYIAAGVGILQTDVIPRDPANTGFTNYLVTGLLPAIGVRTWINRWLAIDAYLKNYIFADQLEPTNRVAMETSDQAKSRAESSFTFNMMFGIGASLFLPPGFEYRTLR